MRVWVGRGGGAFFPCDTRIYTSLCGRLCVCVACVCVAARVLVCQGGGVRMYAHVFVCVVCVCVMFVYVVDQRNP